MLRVWIIILSCICILSFGVRASLAADAWEEYKNIVQIYSYFDTQKIDRVTCRIKDTSLEKAKLLNQFKPIENNLHIDENLNEFEITYSKKYGVSFTKPKFTIKITNPKELSLNQIASVDKFNKEMQQSIDAIENEIKSIFEALSTQKLKRDGINDLQISREGSVATVKYSIDSDELFSIKGSVQEIYSLGTVNKSQRINMSFSIQNSTNNTTLLENNSYITLDTISKYEKVNDRYLLSEINMAADANISNIKRDKTQQSSKIHYSKLGHNLFPSSIAYQSENPKKENGEITFYDCKTGFIPVSKTESSVKLTTQDKIEDINANIEKTHKINHPYGFILTMLNNRTYTYSPSKDILLRVTNEQSETTTDFAEQRGNKSLEESIKDKIKSMKSSNATYTTSPESQFQIDGKKAIKVSFEAEESGIPVKGLLVYTTAGSKILEIKMTCPAVLFTQELAEFENVIQAMKLSP